MSRTVWPMERQDSISEARARHQGRRHMNSTRRFGVRGLFILMAVLATQIPASAASVNARASGTVPTRGHLIKTPSSAVRISDARVPVAARMQQPASVAESAVLLALMI
jgi:hypothetical protein